MLGAAWLLFWTSLALSSSAPLKWSDSIPDFGILRNHSGVDPLAVPSLIIPGVAKAGTTDLWETLVSVHPGFNAHDSSGSILDLEKEFNLGFVSGEYIKNSEIYPCPAETMRSIMRCPESITRGPKPPRERNKPPPPPRPRNLSLCEAWLENPEVHAPIYSLDACPYLMREARVRLPSIMILNTKNNACKDTEIRDKTPLVLPLIRDPINRTVSYYNYFLLRSDAIPLDAMLSTELDILQSARFRPWLAALEGWRWHSAPQSAQEAHVIVMAYERLQLEMIKEMEEVIRRNPRKNFDSQGILIDSIYLPQILGILFPRDKDGRSVNITWPMMVLRSEFFFDHRSEVVRDVLLPFLHPKEESRPRLPPNYEQLISQVEKNSRSGHYSPLTALSNGTSCRVYKFFRTLNSFLVRTLFTLQESGIIAVAPRIKSIEDFWWLRQDLETSCA